MIGARPLAWMLIAVAIVAGTIVDRPRPMPVRTIDGFRVLAVDFHVHAITWTDGGLTPFGLVLDAQRNRLDGIAITGHNQNADGKVARWFSDRIGGPIVLVAQETMGFVPDLVAVGIDLPIDWRKPIGDQIADVHRQGGVAIAAHPVRRDWTRYDAAAIAALDGTEICHPLVFDHPDRERDFEEFAAKGRAAAIGSSDFHGLGRMGMCRTYVFAREATADGILEAIRARRTVVYTPNGNAYGDPAFVQRAAAYPELRDEATKDEPAGVLEWISRLTGLAGLIVLTCVRRVRTRPPPLR